MPHHAIHSVAAEALHAARGRRHSVLFDSGDNLLPLLRASCPWLPWRTEDNGAVSITLSSFLRLSSRAFRLTDDVRAVDPALASFDVVALGAILLLHYEKGMTRIPTNNLDEW